MASQIFPQPREIPGLPRFSRRERAALCQRLQAPIASPRFKVMYLVSGKERQSAWLHSRARAHIALEMMQKKYGPRNCIIVVD